MLKNVSRLILEDSRFLRFFQHCSPLGKFHFGKFGGSVLCWSKFIFLVSKVPSGFKKIYFM